MTRGHGPYLSTSANYSHINSVFIYKTSDDMKMNKSSNKLLLLNGNPEICYPFSKILTHYITL